ncbi:hypothetical protein, partial [Zarconia navalis]|uniref:hypothetical protein n=1 Tax=Zarconia navalis TaxID=2992134 RepID=UPI0021F8623B
GKKCGRVRKDNIKLDRGWDDLLKPSAIFFCVSCKSEKTDSVDNCREAELNLANDSTGRLESADAESEKKRGASASATQ